MRTLEHPEVTLQAIAVGGLLTGIYGCLAATLIRRGGSRLRGDETLALGACLTVVSGTVLGLAARAMLVLDARTALPTARLNLDLASTLLVALPLAAGLALLLRRPEQSIEFRPAVRRAAPWLALVVMTTTLVSAVGVNSTFRNDTDRRAQAVKELVWANRIVPSAGDPLLPRENSKYPGYLASRAMVTWLAGTDPWRPSVAWIMIAAVGLAAGLVALIRNLGLPLWSAGLALIAMPLLGGDSYRLPAVGDPRPVSAMVMIGGLAFVARGLGEKSLGYTLAGLGGALSGAAALVHLQYVVIAASVLLPTLVLAPALRGRCELHTRKLLFACVVSTVPLCLGLVQALSLPEPATISESARNSPAASESATRENETPAETLLTSGHSVWPPRSVTINGVRLLYQSPSLYVLHPRALVDGLWGERTSALLGLVGLAGALVLRRRASPLLLLLMASTVLIPVIVLFNPVVYPFFDRYFSSYRSEYIGFELPFVGLAAVAAAVAVNRARAMLVALVALVAIVPVAHATVEWQQLVQREHRTVARDAALRTFRDLQRWARYADLIVASSAAARHAIALETESRFVDPRTVTPHPLDAGVDPDAALISLSRLDAERVIVVLDETTPPNAAIRQLIDANIVLSAVGTGGAPGIYWIRVNLPN
jgi:hypothetical protein